MQIAIVQQQHVLPFFTMLNSIPIMGPVGNC